MCSYSGDVLVFTTLFVTRKKIEKREENIFPCGSIFLDPHIPYVKTDSHEQRQVYCGFLERLLCVIIVFCPGSLILHIWTVAQIPFIFIFLFEVAG